MYHPPDYIDNITADRQLREVLRCLLIEWGETELDIASGFFEPEVWRMLGEPLKGLSAFRLLLGRPSSTRMKMQGWSISPVYTAISCVPTSKTCRSRATMHT